MKFFANSKREWFGFGVIAGIATSLVLILVLV